jgi:hypothetical protein
MAQWLVRDENNDQHARKKMDGDGGNDGDGVLTHLYVLVR